MISDFRTPEDELKARQDFMRREGYKFCDMPACNCNSRHGGYAVAMVRNWKEGLVELGIDVNSKTLLVLKNRSIKMKMSPEMFDALMRLIDATINDEITARANCTLTGKLVSDFKSKFVGESVKPGAVEVKTFSDINSAAIHSGTHVYAFATMPPELARLRAENERMRAALKPFADFRLLAIKPGSEGPIITYEEQFIDGVPQLNAISASLNVSDFDRAVAALTPERTDNG